MMTHGQYKGTCVQRTVPKKYGIFFLLTVTLLSGPEKLCSAFGITGALDGADLVGRGSVGDVGIVDDGTPPPTVPLVTARIGLAAGKGDEHLWRFCVPGDPNLSR